MAAQAQAQPKRKSAAKRQPPAKPAATKPKPAPPAFTVPVPQTPRELERIVNTPLQLGHALVDPAYQLLTVEETATLLRVTPKTVYALMYNDGLASYKIGALRRISLLALQQYISSCAVS